jgi:DNA repair protein RadC
MILREAEVIYKGKRIEGSAVIRSPDDVHRICRDMEAYTVEHFCVLHLNAKNSVVSRQTVSIGSANETTVHPREVFRAACIAGAVAVILVHNHPSGDCTPSAEDHALTARLAECGKILGIKVLDHVIVGDGDYRSLVAQ